MDVIHQPTGTTDCLFDTYLILKFLGWISVSYEKTFRSVDVGWWSSVSNMSCAEQFSGGSESQSDRFTGFYCQLWPWNNGSGVATKAKHLAVWCFDMDLLLSPRHGDNLATILNHDVLNILSFHTIPVIIQSLGRLFQHILTFLCSPIQILWFPGSVLSKWAVFKNPGCLMIEGDYTTQ